MIRIRHEQFELELLDVALRISGARETVSDGKQRVDLAESAEKRRARSGHVLHTHCGGCHLLRAHELGEPFQPLVGDRRHPDVGLVGHGRIRRDLGACLGECVEERGLARVGQADDADLECHGGEA